MKVSSWKGNFITGGDGFSFLNNEITKLDSLQKKFASKHLNTTYSKYEPWMSSASNLEEMKQLNDLKMKNEFCLEPESLQLLSKVLSRGHSRNLRNIHFQSDGKIGVRLHADNCFEKEYNQLNGTFDLLESVDPQYFMRLRRLVSQVVIQCSTEPTYNLRTEGTGLSSFNYRKGIFLSIPSSEMWQIELLLNLSHELGHQALINLQMIDRIIEDHHIEKKLYSVIRKTERPSILSFHAMIATAYMVEFSLRNYSHLISLAGVSYFHNRFQLLREDLITSLTILKECSPTDLGEKILKECYALYIFSGELCD